MDWNWYIEHLKKEGRIYLKDGDNVMGRHTTCDIKLNMNNLSRRHVNLTLNHNVVILKLMSAANGVFINSSAVEENESERVLHEGDIIWLGCPPKENITPNDSVYVLKKCINPLDGAVVISDDESEGPSTNINDNSKKDEQPTTNAKVHMPIISEIKEEIFSKTTEEIRNIFGDADEDILHPLLKLNPYVFNKLQTDTQVSINGKICHGDTIELGVDEQNFNMTQAMLFEIKEEMADDVSKLNGATEEFMTTLSPDCIKTEFPRHSDDGEVIVIESDDDDLYAQIEHWTSSTNEDRPPPSTNTEALNTINEDIAGQDSPKKSANNDMSESESEMEPNLEELKKKRKLTNSTSFDTVADNSMAQFKRKQCKVRIKNVDLNDFSSSKNYKKSVELEKNVSADPGLTPEPNNVEINEIIDEHFDTSAIFEAGMSTDCIKSSHAKKEEIIVMDDDKDDDDEVDEDDNDDDDDDGGDDIGDIKTQTTTYRNQSKSFQLEEESDIINKIRSSCTKKSLERPPIIEPPHLPTKRGKLRGVSASTTKINKKQKKQEKRNKKIVQSCNIRLERVKMVLKQNCADKIKIDVMRANQATMSTANDKTSTDKGQAIPNGRPAERHDAKEARLRRTCNRTTFAEMEQYSNKMREIKKSLRNLRFNVITENTPKKLSKDCKKMFLSTYNERRELARSKWKVTNYSDAIITELLMYANNWLRTRMTGPNQELQSIPVEFKNFTDYKTSFKSLMKDDFVSTIARQYKSKRSLLKVKLLSYSTNVENIMLVVLCEDLNFVKCELYSLIIINQHNERIETFTSLKRLERVNDDGWKLTLQVLHKDCPSKHLQGVDTLHLVKIADSLRLEVELFNAIHHLPNTPLFRNILRPSEYPPVPIKLSQMTSYKGMKADQHQSQVCLATYHRLVDDSTPSITVIHGPTGTGKSYMVSNLGLQCLYGQATHILDRKILICAQNNATIESVVYNLKYARDLMKHDRFKLLRFGLYERMSEHGRSVSLKHYLERDRIQKEIEETHARKGGATNEQLKIVLTPKEIYDFSKRHIEEANIVCTTLSSCGKLSHYVNFFDICIIDDATRCIEPLALMPLRFSIHGLVLVGNVNQKADTVWSQDASKLGLSESMLTRIKKIIKNPCMKVDINSKIFELNTQYRMHPEISQWPNEYFFENQLSNAANTQQLIAPVVPYTVINFNCTTHTINLETRSIYNNDEAIFVINLITQLDKHMPTKRFHYLVMTPNCGHSHLIQRLMPINLNVKAGTIEEYRVYEPDVLIFSNGRTHGDGFEHTYNKFHVALTRPRRCLIICGNFDYLLTMEMWRNLQNDAIKRQLYFHITRAEANDLHTNLISKMLTKPNTPVI